MIMGIDGKKKKSVENGCLAGMPMSFVAMTGILY